MASCRTVTLNLLVILFLTPIIVTGCIRYSLSGTSIPEGVETIFIPFFSDQSSGGLGDLNDRLNRALINRFVNQSRLTLSGSEESAHALVNGSITSYQNRPFSVGGSEQANLNQVQITVSASFMYSSDNEQLWNKTFTGSATYDVIENPVDGEVDAANEALDQIANNMFNDAVSSW